MHQPRTKEAGRGVFENNKCRFFNAGTMALLSPARRDDRHADHRRRCHAGHHDDNGPSPPPPHSKLSFLLFDFTFGQEFRSAASADSLAVAQEERPATRKGVWGGWGVALMGICRSRCGSSLVRSHCPATWKRWGGGRFGQVWFGWFRIGSYDLVFFSRFRQHSLVWIGLVRFALRQVGKDVSGEEF